MELRPVRLSDAEAGVLLAGLAGEYEIRYGPNDELTTTDDAEFEPPEGLFLVLTGGEDGGTVVAGGGFRRLDLDTCEVKRMWTHPDHRRRGHGTTVLRGLEDAARAAGYATLRLETGPRQPEAEALYTSTGYRRIPVYGRYPTALAFELPL